MSTVSSLRDHLLYEIYRKRGQRAKQIAQARKLTRLRDTEFLEELEQVEREAGKR